MTTRTRSPVPALRPFVKALWATEGSSSKPGARERVLPTGSVHVVFRLSDHPLCVFDASSACSNSAPRTVGCAIVGGARSRFYVRDISQPARSVGVELLAGAAPLLLGVPACELAEQHVRLDDLWGPAASEWRERIGAEASLDGQLDVFERLLLARFPRVRGIHPAVAVALEGLRAGSPVVELVEDAGVSHRHFIEVFRDAVGLSPKRYGRVLRLQRALALAAEIPRCSWAWLAAQAGYSDQPHLVREFRDITGVTPGAYLRALPSSRNHLEIVERSRAAPGPLGERHRPRAVKSIQDLDAGGAHSCGVSRRGTRRA